MNRAIEKQVNKAMRRVTFYRFVQIAFSVLTFPFAALAGIFRTAANICDHISNWGTEAINILFALEVEQARRYESLTGARLGLAIGRTDRYTDLHDPDDARFLTTPVSD